MWLRDDADKAVDSLLQDCEAVLTGRYAEHLVLHGVPVPVWAWTNLLAHGSEDNLRHPETGVCGHASAGVQAFHAARAYLAGEVLDVAKRVGSLTELQALTLVPLELALAEQPASYTWGPGSWVRAVLTVLSEERTA